MLVVVVVVPAYPEQNGERFDAAEGVAAAATEAAITEAADTAGGLTPCKT